MAKHECKKEILKKVLEKAEKVKEGKEKYEGKGGEKDKENKDEEDEDGENEEDKEEGDEKEEDKEEGDEKEENKKEEKKDGKGAGIIAGLRMAQKGIRPAVTGAVALSKKPILRALPVLPGRLKGGVKAAKKGIMSKVLTGAAKRKASQIATSDNGAPVVGSGVRAIPAGVTKIGVR
jgi:hypothetical protein